MRITSSAFVAWDYPRRTRKGAGFASVNPLIADVPRPFLTLGKGARKLDWSVTTLPIFVDLIATHTCFVIRTYGRSATFPAVSRAVCMFRVMIIAAFVLAACRGKTLGQGTSNDVGPGMNEEGPLVPASVATSPTTDARKPDGSMDARAGGNEILFDARTPMTLESWTSRSCDDFQRIWARRQSELVSGASVPTAGSPAKCYDCMHQSPAAILCRPLEMSCGPEISACIWRNCECSPCSSAQLARDRCDCADGCLPRGRSACRSSLESYWTCMASACTKACSP